METVPKEEGQNEKHGGSTAEYRQVEYEKMTSSYDIFLKYERITFKKMHFDLQAFFNFFSLQCNHQKGICFIFVQTFFIKIFLWKPWMK